ncbi:kynureninase [Epithele typhae]|uniref:kynureninase n=1 Tax=Epithele typhae TaxID=378194 RepID=UPI0020072EA6|nr:kynureninase [Epithele typhae]KAH9946003.1 kynureninase [Epithele typhae]
MNGHAAEGAKAAGPPLPLRDEFVVPTMREVKASKVAVELADAGCTYMCGNSLGLMSKRTKQLVEEELAVWATRGVEGHFDHPHGRNWKDIADLVTPHFAQIVGAKESEVACMGTLTANLHLMINSFYKPTRERYRILCEDHAFPSDQYAFATQVAAHGFDPDDAVLALAPRPGEFTLRTEDILRTLAEQGDTVALVLFSGVQYYTGQLFAVAEVTAAARAAGCAVGWDLAHAAGNVPLRLHDWGPDFAVWCTYKYLNSGPGGIAGLFVHERWADLPIRQAGWWGHDRATRFAMPPRFAAIRGAQGFQQSNPSALATAALLGALAPFAAAGYMAPLRARSLALTGRLEALLHRSRFWVPVARAAAFGQGAKEEQQQKVGVTSITPADPAQRGAQLSLLFVPAGRGVMPRVLAGLEARGVIVDARRPDVIRVAPAPLYNTMEDVERAAAAIEEVLVEVDAEGLPPVEAVVAAGGVEVEGA